jgi:DUF883 C-terminal glycine zipper region
MEHAMQGKADGRFDTIQPSNGPAPNDEALIELRQDLDWVLEDWNELLRQTAARSAVIANDAVRARPWVSVTIAAALGALLATALVSRRRPGPVARAAAVEPPQVAPALARRWVADTHPLMSRLSQTWDSIAALNANALPTLPSMDVMTGILKAMLPTKTGH